MRQVGEDRPTTEQCLGGLLRLSSHLDHPLQCARARRRGCLQVRIGSRKNQWNLLRDLTRAVRGCINSEILFLLTILLQMSFILLLILEEKIKTFISPSCFHTYILTELFDINEE